MRPAPRQAPAPAATGPARRWWPSRGQPVPLSAIRGAWWPSGAVAGAGVFAVVWATRTTLFWCPLHDFAPADQLRLIDECRSADDRQGDRRAWHGSLS